MHVDRCEFVEGGREQVLWKVQSAETCAYSEEIDGNTRIQVK